MDCKERIEAAKEQLKAADAVEYNAVEYKLPDSAHAIRTAVYAIFPELQESEDENFIGCVACIYQDSCNSLQFGQGCTDGKDANRG